MSDEGWAIDPIEEAKGREADETLPPAPAPTPVAIPETLLTECNFLCGGAGTGKTYLAKQLVQASPGTVLAASTGIAAVNLGEGTTINALLGYFDTASLEEAYFSGRLITTLRKLYQSGLRRIVLDEVSMLSGDQLTVITQALNDLAGGGYDVTTDVIADEAIAAQQIEEGLATIEDRRRWPIALTLVGDFAQLPPVKAPFAFESAEWARYQAQTVTLTEVRRQDDPLFVEGLWGARRGQVGRVLDVFQPQLVPTSDSHFPGLTVFAKNEEVDRFNGLRLTRVAAPPQFIASTRWGKQQSEWTKNIPERLVLKVGATVMILANLRQPLSQQLIYANGDMGTVSAIDPDRQQVWVTLQRTGQDVCVDRITRQVQVPLEPGRRKILRAEGKDHTHITEDGRKEIVGAITYMPLRLAYASTVHKCQGLSLDQVQVNIRDGFFKTPGMLYVALSRARTLAGLRIVGTAETLRARCTVDARVVPWL